MKFFTFYLLCIVSTLCDANNASDNSLQQARRSNEVRCPLPRRSDKDKTYIVNCNENFKANKEGDYVPENTRLHFTCNPGYGHYEGRKNFTSKCDASGSWDPPIYPCLKKCATLNSAPDVKCYHNHNDSKCNGEYLAGTTLQASCSAPYHHPNHKEIVCNGDGKWSVKNIKCVADCGIYSKEAEKLYENKKYLPWHVIVLKHGSISSGTLIAPHLVMCDATAVVDETGKPLPKENLKIIVNFSLPDRKEYKVKSVFFPPQGFRLVNNITILNLTEKVEISATVMPACVNRDGLRLPFDLSSVIGEVVMTRTSPDNGKSNLAKADLLKVKMYNFSRCVSKIQGNNTLNYDQFCGNIEGEGELDKPDSGGGYYIKNPQDDLYYITGVYTHRSSEEESVRLFTNLATHMEWINAIYEETDAIDNNDVVKYSDCGKYSLYSKLWYDESYYPWHVLVRITHFEKSHTFSGTLIAPNLVLTDSANKFFIGGDRVPVNNITVIVNGFLDVEDQTIYKIEEIYSPLQRFSNEIPEQVGQLRGDDIAVLHLVKNLTISSLVQPVCVDWTGVNLPPTSLPLENQIVRVRDRETLEHEDDDVHIISTKFHHPEFCTRILAGHQQIHLSYDQFCAQNKDTAVLGRGDVGGGSYVRGLKDDLFYIKGIYIGNISNLGISVYTDLATHMEWLNAVNKKVNGKDERHPEPSSLSSNRFNAKRSQFGCDPDQDIIDLHKKYEGCYLPKKTDNHIDYNITCPDKHPKCFDSEAEWVVDNTRLEYWCDPEKEYGSHWKQPRTSICQKNNHQWMPKIEACGKKCDEFFHDHMNLACISESNNGNVSCDDLIDGTRVTLSCQEGFISKHGRTLDDTQLCQNGEWFAEWKSQQRPQCVARTCIRESYSFTGFTYESNLIIIS